MHTRSVGRHLASRKDYGQDTLQNPDTWGKSKPGVCIPFVNQAKTARVQALASIIVGCVHDRGIVQEQ